MSPIETRPALTVAPEDVPAKMDELSAAIRAHRELLRHVGALFGEAVGERLLRSLEKVDDASDSVDYGIMALRREIENGADYAREREAERAELAKVLDVATMQQARDNANALTAYSRQNHDPVTLVKAAEFNRDERVRLFTECQARQRTIEEMSAEQDQTIIADMEHVHAYRQALRQLVREKVVTRARANKIDRDAEAAYQEAAAR